MNLIINGQAESFEQAFSALQLIKRLDLADKRLALELNGEIVPRSEFAVTRLRDGDRLEIITAVGGG